MVGAKVCRHRSVVVERALGMADPDVFHGAGPQLRRRGLQAGLTQPATTADRWDGRIA